MDQSLLSECLSSLSKSDNLNYGPLSELSKESLMDLINNSYLAMSDPNHLIPENISKETSEELRSMATASYYKAMSDSDLHINKEMKNNYSTLNDYLRTKYGKKLDVQKITNFLDNDGVDKVLEERFLELFTTEI